MTSRNDNRNVNRRNFIAAAAPLVVAVPAAAAVSPASPDKPAAPAPGQHGGAHAPGVCACRDCRDRHERERARTDGNPLWRATLRALSVGLLALDRLTERGSHCDDWDCELCLCADATGHVVYDMFELMDGSSCHSEQYICRQPATSLPADAAAYVALHDVLDGLLDFTAGHCPEGDDSGTGLCACCDRADYTVYFVKEALAIFSSLGADRSGTAADDLLVARRELRSAERKVARERRRVAAGGEFLRHTARQHLDPEHDVEHCRWIVKECEVGAAVAKRRARGQDD